MNLPGLQSDVAVLVVLHQVLHLAQNIDSLRWYSPQQRVLHHTGRCFMFPVNTSQSLSCTADVGHQSHVPQQLILVTWSVDQLEDRRRTPGVEEVRDVVIIAGDVDQETRRLQLQLLQDSVIVRVVCQVVEEMRKQRMQMMMPVRKHGQVSESQEYLCWEFWIRVVPAKTVSIYCWVL